MDQTKDDPKDVIGGSLLNQPRTGTRPGAAGMNSEPFDNHFASTKLDSTLVGESKFLQVDDRAGTMGATWKETGKELQVTPGFQPDMLEEKSRKNIKHEIDSSSLGSTSKLLESLPVKNDEDTNDPLRILEGAVNAIREARHEDGGHSLASSAFLSHRTSGVVDGGFATGEVAQAVEKGRNVAEIPLEDLLQSQGDWGNVLRHFGAESEETEQKELRRQHASHCIGERSRSEGGYPQKLERLDQTDMNSFCASGTQRSDRVQDSLDLLQDLQQFQATNGSQVSQVSGGQLGTLGLQRPIVKDDFATLAAATPEDFDAFLARLKGQEGDSLGRGRSPQVSGMNVKDPRGEVVGWRDVNLVAING